jgi:hypothetical protein
MREIAGFCHGLKANSRTLPRMGMTNVQTVAIHNESFISFMADDELFHFFFVGKRPVKLD